MITQLAGREPLDPSLDNPMRDMQKQNIIVQISATLAIPAVVAGAATFEVFHYTGLAGAGRIAAFSVFILFGVVAKCRPLWRERWLWIFFSVVVGLHAVIISVVSWPDTHYPALLIAPFSFADFFLLLKLVEIIDRHMNEARLSS